MEIYFNPTGSINRMTYFRHSMIVIGIALLVIFLTIIIGVSERILPNSPMGYVMSIPTIIIFHYTFIILTIKRLRHIGKSEWWSVLILVPFLSNAVHLVLLFVKGKE